MTKVQFSFHSKLWPGSGNSPQCWGLRIESWGKPIYVYRLSLCHVREMFIMPEQFGCKIFAVATMNFCTISTEVSSVLKLLFEAPQLVRRGIPQSSLINAIVFFHRSGIL
jgi:hypothetical protein